MLKVAELVERGLLLGPACGRIVGEVIVRLLEHDRYFIRHAPGWRSLLPTRSGQATGDFRMVDFLTFAGVDPTSREQ